jgi:hypothetical protein
VFENIIRYETTIQGNALALAKAGKPVSRASGDRVLQEFFGRVKCVKVGFGSRLPIIHPAGLTCSVVNFREDLRNESGKPIVRFLL